MSRAFVVQLNAECDPESNFRGRVEHVRSGEAIHFRSWEEFLAFVIRIVGNERGDERAGPSGDGCLRSNAGLD